MTNTNQKGIGNRARRGLSWVFSWAFFAAVPLGSVDAATVQVTNAGGNDGTENVLFNNVAGGDVTSGSYFVRGHTGSGAFVDFESSEILQVNTNGAGGQANIFDTAQNGFDSMIVRYADQTLGIKKLIIGIAATENGGTIEFFTGSSYVGSPKTFTAGTTLKGTDLTTTSFDIGTGNTLFQIVAGAGEYLTSVDFRVSGTSGVSIYIDDVSQARIGGVDTDTPAVPLPAPALAGLALMGGLGATRLRRRRPQSA